MAVVENKEEDWKNVVKEAKTKFGEDITDTLTVIGRSKVQTSQNYEDAVKLIQARINNLESNLHIEIDMERIEDRSKALSYIGIEVADALKVIPAPVDTTETETVVQENTATVTPKVEGPVVTFKEGTGVENVNTVQEQVEQEQATYLEETQVEVKPTLWQKIKNSKFAKAIGYIFRLNTMNETQALPEGRGENVN